MQTVSRIREELGFHVNAPDFVSDLGNPSDINWIFSIHPAPRHTNFLNRASIKWGDEARGLDHVRTVSQASCHSF
jgi:hypothetical protein